MAALVLGTLRTYGIPLAETSPGFIFVCSDERNMFIHFIYLHPMERKQNNRIPNALDEKDSRDQDTTRFSGGQVETESETGNSPRKKIDFWRIFFRTGLAVFFGFLIAGIMAGLMEGAGVGYGVSFGSPLMFGLTLVTVAGFWVLFSFIGPYKVE